MSEGPEVKIVADQISKALSNNIKIQNIIHNKLDNEMKNSIIGSYLKYVKTFGKNIVLKFSNDIYLRNHMMMWGKWRIYDKNDYDNGWAKPPSSSKSFYYKKDRIEDNKSNKNPKNVKEDKRTRLTIITKEKVLVQFNGPILQFSYKNPAKLEPIISLGPDGLDEKYDKEKVKHNIFHKSKNELLIANALLDQKIVCGIGNKYKSEILFLNNINPFKNVPSISDIQLNNIVMDIPRVLKYGYGNNGRTRDLNNDEKMSLNTTHWVFRRIGKPCWNCGSKILSDRKKTPRITFWCPTCQPLD